METDVDRSRSARNQGRDKRGEIWMSLITCGSVHQGHEWFIVMTLEEDEICTCLTALLRLYYVSNFVDSRMEGPRYLTSPTS